MDVYQASFKLVMHFHVWINQHLNIKLISKKDNKIEAAKCLALNKHEIRVKNKRKF